MKWFVKVGYNSSLYHGYKVKKQKVNFCMKRKSLIFYILICFSIWYNSARI